MTETKIFTYKDIGTAAKILRRGGIVAFPTETVYGLGVVYDDKAAYDRLVAIKRRKPDKPFTLMCAGVAEIGQYAEVSAKAQAIIDRFLPGPLTIVLPAIKKIPPWVDLGTGAVGIRVSNLQALQELLVKVGKPLLVPSANRSDEKPALSGEETLNLFGGEIEGVIMGMVGGGQPSTVIEITRTDEIVLRRPGPITLEKIIGSSEEEL